MAKDLKLKNLEYIKFKPTLLESTSLMMVYGKDIYFKEIAPENVP